MTNMTHVYGFDSKREAQSKKMVGAKIWDAEITDHSNPESLLVVIANGPVTFNPSGPREWEKEVTYRRATVAEWAAARLPEIQKIMSSLSPEWDNKSTEYLSTVTLAHREQYTALKDEADRLRAEVAA